MTSVFHSDFLRQPFAKMKATYGPDRIKAELADLAQQQTKIEALLSLADGIFNAQAILKPK